MIDPIYRAKEINTDNWVYGYHIITKDKHFICDINSLEIERIKDNVYSICSNNVIEVDVKTLGQSIGYMDSHGNNIFAGDIVKFDDSCAAFVWFNNELQCLDPVFIDRCFFFNGTDFMNDYPYDYADFCVMLQDPYGDFTDRIEVIGNIFDNKNFLKNCKNLSYHNNEQTSSWDF